MTANLEKLRYLLVVGIVASSTAVAVTWEEQATRLQNISASLIENLPMSAPVHSNLRMGLENRVSMLPKVNPQVGSKSEKVPSSPIHAIPMLTFETSWILGLRLWAGYLPPGLESLIGIDAKLTQKSIGGEIQPSIGPFYFVLGVSKTSAKLLGAITAIDAKDEFDMTSSSVHIASGLKFGSLFTNVMFIKKNTDSRLVIPSDQTEVSLTDKLNDSSPPFGVQLMGGLWFWGEHRIALGVLHQDKRLTMPRLLVDFGYGF